MIIPGIGLQKMCHLPKMWSVPVSLLFSLCSWLLEHHLLYIACSLQQADSERPRSSSRNGSTSKRPVIPSSRPSSSGEPSEIRSSRLIASSSRLSTTQRIQPGLESKTSFTRASGTRGGRDDTLRSFELLSIGTGKRKWRTVWSADFLCQGVTVPFKWNFEVSTIVGYSYVYFHLMLGPFKAKAHWNFFMRLWQTPLIPLQMFFHDLFPHGPIWRETMLL